MRLWSLHPRYLDRQGLLAVWREGLLAKKVLLGKTVGYRQHPQLLRFKLCSQPVTAIDQYLAQIYLESKARGYHFDASKFELNPDDLKVQISVTKGQLKHELAHLQKKLKSRSWSWYRKVKSIDLPKPHPIFSIQDGPVEVWEKLADRES